MATTPTQLPVPSEKPQDLKFNAGKIDEYVTSMGWTYTDRFGNKHYTIEGVNYLAQQVMNAFGYITLTGVDFDTGANVSTPNELLFNPADNSYYKWTGSYSSGPKIVPEDSTPQSAGGIGPGKWLNVGDAALRSELALPGGAGIIGGVSKPITFWPEAVGDGVTDSTEAFSAAESSSFNDIYLPEGNFKVDDIALNKRYWGPGVISRSGIGSVTRTGIGLNDISFTGAYSGIAANSLKVKILTTGAQDTLAWSADGGATWVTTHLVYNSSTDSYDELPINAGPTPYLLVVGVSVAFASITGHTVGDTWTVTLIRNPKAIQSDGGFYQNGKMSFSLFGVRQISMGEDAFGAGKSVGSSNIGMGYKSLYANDRGYANISIGGETLKSNKSGFFNIGVGDLALGENTTGQGSVSVGVYSFGANITGNNNTGLGTDAGRYNESGSDNIAVGPQSLYQNKAGIENVGIGKWALRGGSESLSTGTSVQYCTSVGSKSQYKGVANNNTSIGFETLYNVTGTDNFAGGFDAGFTVTAGNFNVFLGSKSGAAIDQYPTATNCVLLGDNTKSSGNNAVAIGSGVAAPANAIVIGNAQHTQLFIRGNLLPQADGTQNIGKPDARFNTVYATVGAINTSNEEMKTELLNIEKAEKAAALAIKASIRKFKMLDAVELKGMDGARWHFGVGAQTVGNIMREHGLDPAEYGFWCYDKWDDKFEPVYASRFTGKYSLMPDGTNKEVYERYDTGKVKLVKYAGETYGIRYDELSMFILSCI